MGGTPSKKVNIYAAKGQLSKLIDEVAAGAEIVIARNGRPVARLVPLAQRPAQRVPGGWEGKVWIAPDIDKPDGEPDRELIDQVENKSVLST